MVGSGMKKLLAVLLALSLTACHSTSITQLRVQVTPSTGVCQNSTGTNPCLILRIFNDQSKTFGDWFKADARIEGFSYEAGYLYDLSIQRICTQVAVGDGTSTLRLQLVNSKTPSSDIFTPTAELSLNGIC